MASICTSMPVLALNSGSRSWTKCVSGTFSIRMLMVWARAAVGEASANANPAASKSLLICVPSLIVCTRTTAAGSFERPQRQSLDQVAAHERQQHQHGQDRD